MHKNLPPVVTINSDITNCTQGVSCALPVVSIAVDESVSTEKIAGATVTLTVEHGALSLLDTATSSDNLKVIQTIPTEVSVTYVAVTDTELETVLLALLSAYLSDPLNIQYVADSNYYGLWDSHYEAGSNMDIPIDSMSDSLEVLKISLTTTNAKEAGAIANEHVNEYYQRVSVYPSFAVAPSVVAPTEVTVPIVILSNGVSSLITPSVMDDSVSPATASTGSNVMHLARNGVKIDSEMDKLGELQYSLGDGFY